MTFGQTSLDDQFSLYQLPPLIPPLTIVPGYSNEIDNRI